MKEYCTYYLVSGFAFLVRALEHLKFVRPNYIKYLVSGPPPKTAMQHT